jgi:hypothetical protein
MIVRILGEGQFEISSDRLDDLNRLDQSLVSAIESGDEQAFEQSLSRLLDEVKSHAQPVPDDYLGPSDFVLPGPDTSLDEVRELLGEEGLIPG